MKNERGFFTIVGLCLLLAVAISIRGVQEFERNYSAGALNSLAEFELQNSADSALIRAIELDDTATQNFHSDRFKKIEVKIFRYSGAGYIRRYERVYSGSSYTDKIVKRKIQDESGNEIEINWEAPATIWLSVASCENPNVSGKIYRRALAYVLDDETVCFMNNQ